MRKCKICGLSDIEYDNDTCKICGWEADTTQEENPDYVGGANLMTYNQYIFFWNKNKENMLREKDVYAKINLPIKFYFDNFKEINEEILRKEESGEIEQKIK